MTLTDRIEDIFHKGRFEVFEDGMYSDFSRALTFEIERRGDKAVKVIDAIIDDVCPLTASEALRWIGDADGCNASRLMLLARCLESESFYIRDGAILGLSYLGNPAAIPALRKAAEGKREAERRNIELAIEDLEWH